MTLFIISLLLLSAIGKSICDTLQFRYSRSIFAGLPAQWWNPQVSWTNKHTWSNRYLIRLSLQTWLVTITDAWHLFQAISYKSLHGAIGLLLAMVDYELGFFELHAFWWFCIVSLMHQSLFQYFWSLWSSTKPLNP